MKSARNKKNKTREHMSDALFGELKESLGQALQHVRGKRADLRVTVLPAPPSPMSRSEIVELRGELNCSQAVFARLLNVSLKTVQAWEKVFASPATPP